MAYSYSFNLLKPDCIARGLMGKVISRFEEKGLKLVDMKWLQPTERQIRLMYEDKQTYAVFPEIMAYLVGQPVIAMVWAGEDASEKARLLIGEKDPMQSEAGSVRGSMADDRVHNLVHGSRSGEEAWQEMLIFFPERWEGTPIPAADRPAWEAPRAVPALMPWWEPEEESAVR